MALHVVDTEDGKGTAMRISTSRLWVDDVGIADHFHHHHSGIFASSCSWTLRRRDELVRQTRPETSPCVPTSKAHLLEYQAVGGPG